MEWDGHQAAASSLYMACNQLAMHVQVKLKLENEIYFMWPKSIIIYLTCGETATS